eukprot:Pgem_evm1s17884
MSFVKASILFLFGSVFAKNALKPTNWENFIEFRNTDTLSVNVDNDVLLPGHVEFVQSKSLVDNTGRDEDQKVQITMHKDALVLFTPLLSNVESVDIESITILVKTANGEIFERVMKHPYEMPGTDQTIDGRPQLIYSKKAWSMRVPWNYITNDMDVLFTAMVDGQELTTTMDGIEVGAPNELMLVNIDLGMLTNPDNRHEWIAAKGGKRKSQLAAEYFQKMPIAKLRVGEYLPIHLREVFLPNGNFYVTKSDDQDAGIYKGDMREYIAKELMGDGINRASMGIPASNTKTKTTRFFRRTNSVTSIGKYTDKENINGPGIDVQHGLSGGASKLTLRSTLGNEFVHEYGHDHGLGHYPGGEKAVFSEVDGWGFDFFKNRFITGFDYSQPGTTKEYDYGKGKIVKAPFKDNFNWNKDAMGGGSVSGQTNSFSQHTLFSTTLIQKKLSTTPILDQQSSTGYKIFQNGQLVETNVDGPKPDKFHIPVMTLVGFYDPSENSQYEKKAYIYPALYANLGNTFTPETISNSKTSLQNSQCSVTVVDSQQNESVFPVDDTLISDNNMMNMLSINLPMDNGQTYTAASLQCRGSELHSRTIERPTASLDSFITVGKEYGLEDVRANLPTFINSGFITPNLYPSIFSLELAISSVYGPSYRLELGKEVIKGLIYEYNGVYYVATDTLRTTTLNDITNWQILGNRLELLANNIDQLPIGVKSNQGYGTPQTSVHYYIPVDYLNVVQSDVTNKYDRVWYGKTEYSSLMVKASNQATGEVVSLPLRARFNGRHGLNVGFGVNSKSNPEVYAESTDVKKELISDGEYVLYPLTMFGIGWHVHELHFPINVYGSVIISDNGNTIVYTENVNNNYPPPPLPPPPTPPTLPKDPTTPTLPKDPTTPTLPKDPTTPTLPKDPTTPTNKCEQHVKWAMKIGLVKYSELYEGSGLTQESSRGEIQTFLAEMYPECRNVSGMRRQK